MRDYASLFNQLLSDLRVSAQSEPISSDMSPERVSSLSLANSFYKKLSPTGKNRRADAAALEKFLSINSTLPTSNFVFVAENEAESCFFDYLRDNLRVALEPSEADGAYDLDFIRSTLACGPGAAQKADSRCMLTKLFASSISYIHADLIPIYRAALVDTGSWADAEMLRFQNFGFTAVTGGKLFFVPKSSEISRTCCTEASLEMLFQKSVGAFIEQRLARNFGITLSSQPDVNRELARIGSLDGSFGTIDLVSASDSIGLQLCRAILPSCPLVDMMFRCRSDVAVLPDGSEVELRMISTMGNGFTFPLQTIIFACAVRAVYQIMGFPSSGLGDKIAVFGDDIIVRREAYNFVCRMLNKLGFLVNVGKSFNTGPFRESCGSDYYLGHNVRGVYIRSLQTPQEICSALNRLTRWSALHDICITRTLRMLRSWLKKEFLIPISGSDDAGIMVPSELSPRSADSSAIDSIYKAYRRSPKRLEVIDSDGNPLFSELGIAVCFLAGHLRHPDVALTQPYCEGSVSDPSCSVPIRDSEGARPRYQVSKFSIPFWDYVPSDQAGRDPWGLKTWSRPIQYGPIHDQWKKVMMAIYAETRI